MQYLVIEGNIGAGKTSLATLISELYGAKLILERFADNPFLPKFYEDQERYAFPVARKFMVAKAYAAEKKAYPVRWLMCVVSTISAFVFAVLMMLFIERYKDLLKFKH